MTNKISLLEYKKLLGETNDASVYDPNDRPKYRNKKVRWAGMWRGDRRDILFDSIKERDRGIELIRLDNIGEIRDLDLQKKFTLLPRFRDERGLSYVADFYYFEPKLKKFIIEDVKSEITRKEPRYVIKRKLVKWFYPEIEFMEY